ncbi:Coagulation factor X [Trichinella spiralis]|uniref:limulus clotting factor C n=1 Tax=Trichinella spiralis TaxID=6334 RepID=A0A0V1C1Q9_TRISP|nr:Coagulation factor X [Trichinella spiralis]
MKLQISLLIFLLQTVSTTFTEERYACGLPYFKPILNFHASNRIVGGFETKPHSHPWQVFIKIFQTNKMFSTCGGSIIQQEDGFRNSSNLVLTAAHCLHDHGSWTAPAKLEVVAGAHSVKNLERTQQKSRVNAYIPGDYSVYTFVNDIALLKLEKPFVFNKFVHPICLPKIDESLPIGYKCMVAGWGSLRDKGCHIRNFLVILSFIESGKLSSRLIQIEAPVLPTKRCWQNQNPKKMFCAGYLEGRKDACQGDSGSPLVCRVGTKFIQYGLVSFGHGCAKKGYPGVYTRVSSFVQWIAKADAKLQKVSARVSRPALDQHIQ